MFCSKQKEVKRWVYVVKAPLLWLSRGGMIRGQCSASSRDQMDFFIWECCIVMHRFSSLSENDKGRSRADADVDFQRPFLACKMVL
jgi:hypothetical protein